MSLDQPINVKQESCSEDIKLPKTDYESYDSLENNTVKYNLKLEREVLDIMKIERDEDQKPGNDRFSCEECLDQFEFIEFLEVHKTIHEPLTKAKKKCPCCKLRFNTTTQYELHIEAHLKYYNQCTFCFKIFLKHHAYIQHVAQHKRNGELTCQYCGKCFKIQKSLNMHIRVHTNERPYNCDFCGKTFKQLSSLNSHRKSIHNQGEPQECSICHGKFSTKSSLTRHIKRIHETGKLQACPSCKKEFPNKELLKQHKMEHHSDFAAFYKMCLVCNEEFFTYEQYYQHYLDVHQTEPENKAEQQISELQVPVIPYTSDKANNKIKRVNCWLCGEKLLCNKYNNHKNDHMLLSVEEILKFSSTGSYPCKKCENVYPTSKQLFEHMDIHMEKQFECDKTCGEKSLFTYLGLSRHLQNSHSLSRIYQKPAKKIKTKVKTPCLLCGTRVSRRAYEEHRNKHMNMSKEELKTYETIGKYPCKQCKVTCDDKNRLFKHMKSHLPKIYACLEGCQVGKTKLSYVSLKYHQLHYHKLFVCSHCKRSYAGLKKFKLHWRSSECNVMSIRKEYLCKWCPTSYSTLVALLNHYRKHVNSAGYQCRVCKQRFMKPFGVKMHMSTAHGQTISLQHCYEQLAFKTSILRNIFTCSWCKVNFATRKGLRSHENLHKSNQHQCKDCKSRFSKLVNYLSHIRNNTCVKWTLEALIPETKNLRCYYCEKSYDRLCLITKHLVTRHMKQPYPCMFCNSNIMLESLRKHLIKKHPNEKKYSCMGCDACFVTLNGYIDHRNCFRGNQLSHRDQIKTDSCNDIQNMVQLNATIADVTQSVSDDRYVKNVTGKIEIDDIIDVPDTVSVRSNGEVITNHANL